MHRYHVHFKALRKQGPVSEHALCVNIDKPIEFDSDIIAVQNHMAKSVGADSAIVFSWRELKGVQRPQEASADAVSEAEASQEEA